MRQTASPSRTEQHATRSADGSKTTERAFTSLRTRLSHLHWIYVWKPLLRDQSANPRNHHQRHQTDEDVYSARPRVLRTFGASELAVWFGGVGDRHAH